MSVGGRCTFCQQWCHRCYSGIYTMTSPWWNHKGKPKVASAFLYFHRSDNLYPEIKLKHLTTDKASSSISLLQFHTRTRTFLQYNGTIGRYWNCGHWPDLVQISVATAIAVLQSSTRRWWNSIRETIGHWILLLCGPTRCFHCYLSEALPFSFQIDSLDITMWETPCCTILNAYLV